MKTTAQIYDQHQRMFRAFMRTTTARAAQLCPDSGGNECLCHNWSIGCECAAGAILASQLWRERWQWWRKLDDAYNAAYRAAEHRTHGAHFAPLWCDHCKAERAARRIAA